MGSPLTAVGAPARRGARHVRWAGFSRISVNSRITSGPWGNCIGRHRHQPASESPRCMPRRQARQAGTGAAVAGHDTLGGRTSAYAAPTRSAGTTPTRSGSAPGPTRSTGSATASRNRVTVARAHPGHQRWTVPGGSFRGVATDVRCHRHRGTARRHRAAGVDLPRPVLPRAVLRDAVALAARDGVKRMCGGDGADDLLSSPVSNGARQGRRPSAAASENP